MRLVRFGEKGSERPGLFRDGRIVDLRKHFPDIPDIGPEFFGQGWIEKISRLDDPGEERKVRLANPVARPEKIICLGKNYTEHAREGNMSIPDKPLLFAKTANTLSGPADPIVLPLFSGEVDFEVELCFVIGRGGKRIAEKDAFSQIAGFCVMNDVSGRQAQFSDKQWFRGKSFDGFAPMGPWLTTTDEAGEVSSLRLRTWVNGKLMQDGNTRDLIFGIAELVSFISQDITLAPGDIVSTGTPAGVGYFREPKVLLAAGDVVRCEVEGLGALENRVEGP
ncbi:MAG: fumarylacetoacetate hydrolase family protein [Thermodesulfobacteriota bacterium]